MLPLASYISIYYSILCSSERNILVLHLLFCWLARYSIISFLLWCKALDVYWDLSNASYSTDKLYGTSRGTDTFFMASLLV